MKAQLKLTGAVIAVVLAAGMIVTGFGSASALPNALPSFGAEAHASGSNLTTAEAEAKARQYGQDQIDRVTAAASEGTCKRAGQALGTIAGRPIAAAEMILVESTFVPENGSEPISIASGTTGSRTSGIVGSGAWLFVFQAAGADFPNQTAREKWTTGATFEVEVVVADATGRDLGETVSIIPTARQN